MSAFLQKLRNKPEASKRRIVLFSSLGLTLIIALIWIGALRVTSQWQASSATDDSAAVAQSSSPFSTLGASFSAIGSGFSQMKSEVHGLFSSTTK